MTYQQASARVLDRIRLNNRRRNHLVANPDDAEFERSDERDDELAAGNPGPSLSRPDDSRLLELDRQAD